MEGENFSSKNIDPKDLMALERAAMAMIGLAISFIILGFIVEKFQLFLLLISEETKHIKAIPQLQNIDFYSYLGIIITLCGVLLALYTYYYYQKWIKLLQSGVYDTDKKIYLALSLIVGAIGLVLIMSMLV